MGYIHLIKFRTIITNKKKWYFFEIRLRLYYLFHSMASLFILYISVDKYFPDISLIRFLLVFNWFCQFTIRNSNIILLFSIANTVSYTMANAIVMIFPSHFLPKTETESGIGSK